jgi:protein AATF/BFR2
LRPDIDPEDDPFAKPDDDSDSDEAPSEAGITGREHYEEVPKSRLRKPEQPILGKQYTGAAVSRKTLFDDEGNEKVEQEQDVEDKEDDSLAGSESVSNISESESSLSGLAKVSSEPEEEYLADYNGFDGENLLTDQRAEDIPSSEIDSVEAFGSGDEERFKSKGFTFRGSEKDLVPEEAAEEIEEGDSNEDGALVWDTGDEVEVEEVGEPESEEDSDLEMEDGDSQSGSEADEASNANSDLDSGTSPSPANKPNTDREKLKALVGNNATEKPTADREELKALINDDAAAVASTLTASADVQKGKAVKQQYATFDRLLDGRIKLQKGLTAANTLSLPSNRDSDIESAAQSAEEAALRLFSTIETLRYSFADASSSKKRKRPSPPTSKTSTDALWTRISTLEDTFLPHRRAILEKWSSKTRPETTISRPQLDRTPITQDSITSALDAQIASETSSSSSAYDDSAFYQSLLRDLISSRASLSQSQALISDIPLPAAAPKQHRKGVDTKASKGRKVRYTVHEKLQNFAAEEERGTWTESARREFFGSLFGGQGMLDEREEIGDEVMDTGVGEEGVLRLFRS